MTRQEEVKEFAVNLEKEIERVESYMPVSISVDFIDRDNSKRTGLIFYSFENFGKWYADSYDSVEILEIIQSEV